MKLNIENKEPKVIKIEKVSSNNEDYLVKVICYSEPIATTKSFGDVYSAATIENTRTNEIVFSLLFTNPLTEEQVDKQFEYMIKKIDKILEDRNNG